MRNRMELIAYKLREGESLTRLDWAYLKRAVAGINSALALIFKGVSDVISRLVRDLKAGHE